MNVQYSQEFWNEQAARALTALERGDYGEAAIRLRAMTSQAWEALVHLEESKDPLERYVWAQVLYQHVREAPTDGDGLLLASFLWLHPGTPKSDVWELLLEDLDVDDRIYNLGLED